MPNFIDESNKYVSEQLERQANKYSSFSSGVSSSKIHQASEKVLLLTPTEKPNPEDIVRDKLGKKPMNNELN